MNVTPLNKLNESLRIRAVALTESDDEALKKLGTHYVGVATELLAAIAEATAAPMTNEPSKESP